MRITNICLIAALAATVSPFPVAAAGQAQPDPRVERQREEVRRRRVVRVERERESDGPEQVDKQSKVIAIGPSGELDLGNIAGDITVTGDGGRDARIEIIKRARHQDPAEAKRQIDLLDVRVLDAPGRVEVRAMHPRNERRMRVSVDYNVVAPSGARLTVKSIAGNVRVTNIKGEVRAESVSGNVFVEGSNHLALAKSVSGNVDLVLASGDMAVTASSISGRVTARGLKGRSVDVGTVSGDLILQDVACDRANIRSVSGNLDYSGTLSKSGRYELKSHSGNVRMSLPGSTGFALQANSFSGNIRSDLPVTLRGSNTEAPGKHGAPWVRRQQAVQGTYGDGSAILEITTFSGNIVIVKR